MKLRDKLTENGQANSEAMPVFKQKALSANAPAFPEYFKPSFSHDNYHRLFESPKFKKSVIPFPKFAQKLVGNIKKELKEKFSQLKATLFGREKPKSKRHDIRESPIFGFDTEYQRDGKTRNNIVIAYSYAIRYQGRMCSGVFKVNKFDKSGRMRFNKFFVKAIEAAIKEEVLEEWPEHVVMAAFMISADLFSFSNAFKDFKTRLDGVRKSFVTIKEDYGIDINAVNNRDLDFNEQKLWDKNGNSRVVDVSFYDLMLLSPAGWNLEKLGNAVNLPKLKIHKDYSIERMIEFMQEQPDLFDAYSIRDSEIAALYMDKMVSFCCDDLGFKTVPYTIGGIGIKRFKGLLEGDFNEIFGFENIKETRWSKSSARLITSTKRVTKLLRTIFEQFATEGYHGGRNESFLCGLSGSDEWKDYDAPSCYTVILNMLRPIDYGSLRTTKNVNDFIGDVFGVAYVKFKHPKGTTIPTLPVHAGSRGLLYVLEGETVVGAPEIQVAINAGCTVEVIQGIVGDWVDVDNRIFLPFMKEVRYQRNQYVDGSFEERLWKEIGNSLYGKLAQGLRKRAVFDSSNGLSKPIPHSQITNPYFAMIVTSTARALMTEMMLSIDTTKHKIGSVTTDGFITTANLENGEIDLNGPICTRFRECYHMIESSDNEILVKKHEVARIAFMKTRGQETIEDVEGEKQIQARAGVMLPKSAPDKHAFMRNLYFKRAAGDKVLNKHLISNREMLQDEVDFTDKDRMVTLNLDWDCKRLLSQPSENVFDGTAHIFCETTPHNTVKEATEMRGIFDGWRIHNCLKRMVDWADWEDFFACKKLTSNTKVNYQYIKNKYGEDLTLSDGQKVGEGSDGLLRRFFIRALMQDECGLNRDDIGRKELADWLTFYGYDTSDYDVRNGSRGRLVFEIVPVTDKSLKLLRLLLRAFPHFEFEPLFEQTKIHELYQRLY